jgi:hypothetical protein
VHRIPNAYLGFFGPRHTVHIFFPGLFETSRTDPSLTPSEREEFYDNVLFRTASEHAAGNMSDWPPTLEAETWRARNRRGGFSLSSKMIPDWALENRFGECLIQNAGKHLAWAKDAFFLITIQGTKGATQHTPDFQPAKEALDHYLYDSDLNHFRMREAEGERWWIDVGMEVFSASGLCYSWSTPHHRLVIASVLGISIEEATRFASIYSSKYEFDSLHDLTHAGGCRVTPPVRSSGQAQAVYLQLYDTGKSLTFHRAGRTTGKEMSVEEALHRSQPNGFVKGLFNAFSEAAVKTPSNARIELRVPLENANQVLLSFDLEVLRDSLLQISMEDYW